MFFEIGALKKFGMLTGKHLFWKLFLSCRPSGQIFKEVRHQQKLMLTSGVKRSLTC